MPALRSERDGIWGISAEDENGIWFRLLQYKLMVQARMGGRAPLARTIPNLGKPTIETYLDIVEKFIGHWTRVNAVLTPDLTLGTFTVASLQTAHDDLDTKIKAVIDAEEDLRLKREERELDFGDVKDELRDQTSIISRLLLYHATINANFPNKPIALSLPDIFPPGTPATLPTFGFNWVVPTAGNLKMWYDPPTPALSGAVQVFIKEGAAERTMAVVSTVPGQIEAYNFSGITIVGEIDQVELRDGDGVTIARGLRNSGLAEPGTTPGVVLSGSWNVGLAAASLNWTAATISGLIGYQVQVSPGTSFNPSTATIAGNTPPGTTALTTSQHLTNHGDQATFVVITLYSGGQLTSNPLTITRP